MSIYYTCVVAHVSAKDLDFVVSFDEFGACLIRLQVLTSYVPEFLYKGVFAALCSLTPYDFSVF